MRDIEERLNSQRPSSIVTDCPSSPPLELQEEIDPAPRQILRQANNPNAVPLLCPNSPIAMEPITVHSPRPKSEDEKRGTIVSSILNLTATTMGLGMLSLPHAFAQTGVIAGVILIMCSSCLAYYSLTCLVTVGRASGRYSFEGNADFFFGRRGRIALNIVLVTLLYGACVSVLVVVQTLIPTTIRNLLGCHPGQCNNFLLSKPAIGAICVLIVGAVSAQDSMHQLRRSSFIALGGLAYYLCALLVLFAQRDSLIHPSVKAFGTPSECVMALPVMFSSYICQFNIFKVDVELKAEYRPYINLIIRVTIFGIATVAYIIGGLLGYCIIGENVSANIMEDFHSIPTTLAGGAMALTNLSKLPLLFIPLRQSIQEGLGTDVYRYRISALLLVLIYVVSILLGSLTKVLSITGITAGCAISFVFPGLLYRAYLRHFVGITESLLPEVEGGLGLNEDAPEPADNSLYAPYLATGLVCFGVVISFVGLIDIVLNWNKV